MTKQKIALVLPTASVAPASEEEKQAQEHTPQSPQPSIPQPQPQDTPPQQLHTPMDVSANNAMRRLKFTLVHGKAAMTGRFPVHQHLYLQMRRAYEEQDTDRFCAVLQSYVEQASTRVQGVVLPQEFQQEVLPELQRLVKHVGITSVGQYLLAI